jgi:hypothetical protein
MVIAYLCVSAVPSEMTGTREEAAQTPTGLLPMAWPRHMALVQAGMAGATLAWMQTRPEPSHLQGKEQVVRITPHEMAAPGARAAAGTHTPCQTTREVQRLDAPTSTLPERGPAKSHFEDAALGAQTPTIMAFTGETWDLAVHGLASPLWEFVLYEELRRAQQALGAERQTTRRTQAIRLRDNAPPVRWRGCRGEQHREELPLTRCTTRTC